MATEVRYRMCPACRGEYTPQASRCVDCDVELVWADEWSEPAGEAPRALPPVGELACVRVAPLAWIRALSEALQERGVAHRVEPARVEDAPEGQRPQVFGAAQLFGLWVPDEGLEEAAGLDGRIAARLLPEEAPPLAEDDEEACPACGATLAADAVECPDCGLAFG